MHIHTHTHIHTYIHTYMHIRSGGVGAMSCYNFTNIAETAERRRRVLELAAYKSEQEQHDDAIYKTYVHQYGHDSNPWKEIYYPSSGRRLLGEKDVRCSFLYVWMCVYVCACGLRLLGEKDVRCSFMYVWMCVYVCACGLRLLGVNDVRCFFCMYVCMLLAACSCLYSSLGYVETYFIRAVLLV
jgi:hypothetical protein